MKARRVETLWAGQLQQRGHVDIQAEFGIVFGARNGFNVVRGKVDNQTVLISVVHVLFGDQSEFLAQITPNMRKVGLVSADGQPEVVWVHGKVLVVLHYVLGEAKLDAVLGPLLLSAAINGRILADNKQVVAGEFRKVIVDTSHVLLVGAVGSDFRGPAPVAAVAG